MKKCNYTKLLTTVCFLSTLIACSKQIENDEIQRQGADIVFNPESPRTSTIKNRLTVKLDSLRSRLNNMQSSININESFNIASGKIAPCINGNCLGSWSIGGNATGYVQRTGDISILAHPNTPDTIVIKVPIIFNVRVTTRGEIKVSETVKGAAEITGEMRPVLNSDWSINPNLNLTYKWSSTPSFEVGNDLIGKHKVTVSNLLSDEMDSLIADLKNKINKDASSELTVKGEAEKTWGDLFINQYIEDQNIRVSIVPEEVIVANPKISNDSLVIEVGIKAKLASFIGGDVANIPITELPSPTIEANIEPNFELSLPIAIEYDALNTRIASLIEQAPPLKHEISEKDKVVLNFNEVVVYPANSRLAIKMNFTADTNSLFSRSNATVYVLATPSYDHQSKLVSFKDFELGIDTDGDITDTFGWLLGSILEVYVNKFFSIDVSKDYENIIADVNQKIISYNKDGVTLKGEVNDAYVNPIAIFDKQLVLSFGINGGIEIVVSDSS